MLDCRQIDNSGLFVGSHAVMSNKKTFCCFSDNLTTKISCRTNYIRPNAVANIIVCNCGQYACKIGAETSDTFFDTMLISHANNNTGRI